MTDRKSVDISLPVTSRIQIIDTDSSRMVIFVPSGGKKARGIGCFALIWNGFMAVFMIIILSAGGPDASDLWGIMLFLSLFWAVGLGMLYWWIRMRFTRLYLMLEQDRLVVQRVLFGRKSIRETELGPESAASLVEAYQQNDDPVYSVAVTGTDRTAKFGTSLSLDEKQWFVRTINEFLGDRGGSAKPTDDLILRCDACGADIDPKLLDSAETTVVCPSCEQEINARQLSLGAVHKDDEQVPDLDPRDLPAESPIVIGENSSRWLTLSYPAIPAGCLLRFVAVFLIVFSLAFSGGALSALVDNLKGVNGPLDFLSIGISGLFVLAGLTPLLIALFLLRGRISIDLSSDTLCCRWHLGPLGYRKTVPTESITRVAVTAGFSGKSQLAGQPQASAPAGDYRVCVVWVHGKGIPITTFHEAAFVRTLAGLMRFQLHRMGSKLSDD